MWTQSEDAYQTTHDDNSTTIASKTIKRYDAFDEEHGEKSLILPLIEEVGTYFLYIFVYRDIRGIVTNSVPSNLPFHVYFHIIAIT